MKAPLSIVLAVIAYLSIHVTSVESFLPPTVLEQVHVSHLTRLSDRHRRQVSSATSWATPRRQSPNSDSRPTVPMRLAGDFFYALTAPFPDLRKVLQNRRRRQKNSEDPSRAVILPMRTAMLAVAVYLAVGVLSYHLLLEKWPISDAIYFACVVFTTVGYGDLYPTTNYSRIFTAAFGFSGIALLGAVIASLGSRLVGMELEAVRRVKNESRRSLLRVYDLMPKVLHKAKNATSRNETTKIKEIISNTTKSVVIEEETLPSLLSKQLPVSAITWNIFKWISKSLLVMLTGGFVIGKLEGWSLCESAYFGIITASTIGLGDLSPKTQGGRIAAVVMIPALVAAAGEVFAGIAVSLVERRQKEMYQKQMKAGVTEDFIKAMDSDGNGRVSQEEYTLFMLMEMGAVTQHEIDELRKQFKRLDVTRSGYIDVMDIRLMQKLRKTDEARPPIV